MVKMKNAKFIFKFKNEMLPITFVNYFTNLIEIHEYNTRQKVKSGYYHCWLSSDSRFYLNKLAHDQTQSSVATLF